MNSVCLREACFMMVAILVAGEAVCQKKIHQDDFYRDPVFVVKDAFWCSGVREGIADKKITKARIGQPFFLWVSLEGKQEALDLLQENAKPIFAKWSLYSSYGFSVQSGGHEYNELSLRKTSEKWFSVKRLELKKNAMFSFIFWASNPTIRKAGIYYVQLVYYDNSAVQCGNAPCEYKILITN